jgi:hypothetical protein
MLSSCLRLIITICISTSCSGGSDGGSSEGGITPSPPVPSGNEAAAPTITPLARLPGITGLRAYQNQLFWFDNNPFAHFKSWNTSGGFVRTLAMRMGRPFKIVLSGQNVIWNEGPPNGVVPAGMQVKQVGPDGTVTVLAAEQPSCDHHTTDDLIVDANMAYYVTASGCSSALVSSIVRLPFNHQTPVPVVNTSHSIWSLSADMTNLYWLELDIFASTFELKRVAKTGGSPQTLASGPIQNGLGPGMSVGNDHIFFSETISAQGGYRIRQVPIAGGGSTILFEKGNGGPVQSIAADSTNVYWADNTSIQTIPGTGGGPTTLVSVPEAYMTIALSGNILYWMETRCCVIPQSSTINSIPRTGGAVTTIQQGLGFIGGTNRSAFGGSLVVGNGNVYWTEGGSFLASDGYGRIAKSQLGGGSVETVASGIVSISPRLLFIDQFIYIADGAALKKLPISGGFPELLRPLDVAYSVSTPFNGFATDGHAIYFRHRSSPHFVAVPIDGSPPWELPGDPVSTDATGLSFASDRLFWIANRNTINSLPKEGGTISTLLTDVGLLDLITDFSNIFFVQDIPHSFLRTINRMPITGGPVSILVPGTDLLDSSGMTQDDQFVYWTDQTTVGKASKSTGAFTFYELIVKNSGGGIAVDDSSIFWIRDDILFRATPK